MLLPWIFFQACMGQEGSLYRIRTLAFYNLENLFDTHRDTLIYDGARTPRGKDRWTQERYQEKIGKMAWVLSQIGRDPAPGAPDLIGVCEVENRRVLNDLVWHPRLRREQYGIIHFDSPDERGIDVALLYKKAAFSPTASKSHRLLLYDADQQRDYTRDVLVVSGLLDGEELYLLVNHWPSRSGGQARSDPYRKAAAELNLKIIDSIYRWEAHPKLVVMGDFNDNPLDDSLKKILKSTGDTAKPEARQLYNPMEALYKKGAGSLAYRDTWSLFDQILLSANWLPTQQEGYHFWKAGIYDPPYLSQQRGRFRSYPYRTYTGGRYTGGYSDHFPVYAYLLRKAP